MPERDVKGSYDRLAPKLDGSLTLRQIERQYGNVAVDWRRCFQAGGQCAPCPTVLQCAHYGPS